MTVPEASVAVELAQLRGEINTGLEQIKGTLGILVERTNRTDADVKQLKSDTEKDIGELRVEVEALKRNRWPLAAVGALTGVAGAATGVISLLVR
ncbi:hypothetical protein [Streptomyces justiciae]|uniref:DUF3618 domain-containing protein n=1 Tax=Streptomyces justiciae TaxID=2780140 RepID=A0ABU3M6P6_9ACTN|nr:hypothetical protein [Streptomyces justiciae]MDT7847179.1 hypothetical protein [Streptomyces justiciae]